MAENAYRFTCAMLIDDNEVDNMINQKLLENANFAKHIYTYTSGKGALEFFKNIDRNPGFPEDLSPDIVFLDINMPIMNGFAFIDALNKLSDRVTSKLKILLLTQSASPQDIEQAKKSKIVVDYLVKPLNPTMIKEIKG